MPFIDHNGARRCPSRRTWVLTLLASATLAACGSSGRRPAQAGASSAPSTPPAPGRTQPAAPAHPSRQSLGGSDVLPPSAAGPARTWAEYRVQAARHLVRANPGGTYLGEVPDPLLAIPVLEINLNADGSVASIRVERHPRQAQDTVQIATAAVKRAAPFPPVGHLPKPWRFIEVFLFDDNRKFKPRTLD